MRPEIIFFPVANGDMTLLKLENGRKILIDINVRQPGDGIRDVVEDLRKELGTDDAGRPYVDVMVLSHPDEDHCRGFEQNFHVGPVSTYSDKDKPKKIIVREMWSSPLVFRRSSKNHKLCPDALVWNAEAKRRANLYKQTRAIGTDGDRILILGEDEGGKTDDILDIVLKVGESIDAIGGKKQPNFSGLLLAPLQSADLEEEDRLSKNQSSVIMNYAIGVGNEPNAVKFLSGGDAEVAIWEKLWGRHKSDSSLLEYNLLSTPHHCSWRSLSWDSWSGLGRKAKVSPDARKALGQALPGAMIVASSKPITDDDSDPPCVRAEEEYQSIVSAAEVNGEFWNTGIYPTEENPDLLRLEVFEGGLKRVKVRSASSMAGVGTGTGTLLGSTPLNHGGSKSEHEK